MAGQVVCTKKPWRDVRQRRAARLNCRGGEQRQAAVARANPGIRLVQDVMWQLGGRPRPLVEDAAIPFFPHKPKTPAARESRSSSGGPAAAAPG